MAKTYTWTEAFFQVWTLNINGCCGRSNWRLPTIQELFSLADHKKVAPACSLPLKTLSEFYWSATPFPDISHFAWCVHFLRGEVYGNDKTCHNYVRAVYTDSMGRLVWSITL